MTYQEIYNVARNAGFPHETAVKMVAIAMKESSGNPRAFNGRGPDQSYGLWQINMIGALGPERRRIYGLAVNEDLYDPATNARVAFSLWGGNDRNLARHWGIEIEPYATSYRNWYARVAPLFSGSTVVAADVSASGAAQKKTGGKGMKS